MGLLLCSNTFNPLCGNNTTKNFNDKYFLNIYTFKRKDDYIENQHTNFDTIIYDNIYLMAFDSL